MAVITYSHPMQRDVAAFHNTYLMPNLMATPGPLPLGRIELRVGLFKEEGVDELRQETDGKSWLTFNPVLVIDAIIDTIYVTFGTLVEMGHDAEGDLTDHAIHPVFSPERLYQSAKALSDQNEKDMQVLLTAFNTKDAELSVSTLSRILSNCLTALSHSGVDPQPFFDEVQRSNMSKLDEDGNPIFSRGVELDGFPAGKVLKGRNYFKPDLAAIFDRLYKESE